MLGFAARAVIGITVGLMVVIAVLLALVVDVLATRRLATSPETDARRAEPPEMRAVVVVESGMESVS